MVVSRNALFVALSLGMACLGPSVAIAQSEVELSDEPVSLTSVDGGVVLRGVLVNYEDGQLTIRTAIGEVTVSTDKVTCDGEGCPEIKPPAARFTVAGSPDLTQYFMPALLRAHAARLGVTMRPGGTEAAPNFSLTDEEGDDLAVVTIRTNSSTDGFSDLLQGDAGIALSTRAVAQRELDVFAGSGLGDLRSGEYEHVIALDGIFFVTSPQNPVRSITLQEAAQVFSGEITNWSDLGGLNAPINLYRPDRDTDTVAYFERTILEAQNASLSPQGEVLPSDEDIGRRVIADPNGIGITNFAGRGSARSLQIEDVCGLASAPSDFNIKSEDYPLTRRLYAYRSNEPQGEYVEKMLDFIAVAASQSAIGGAGFADQRIVRLSVGNQGARFATAMAEASSPSDLQALQSLSAKVLASDRLSTTFRFARDTTELDGRSRENLRRLANFLANPAAGVGKIKLLGFTGSDASQNESVAVSSRAAEAIRDALIELNPSLAETIEFETEGFGEVAPIACNDTAEGRWINTRVEVWAPEPGR